MKNCESTLTKAEWSDIKLLQQDRCWWCGVMTDLTIDHVIPISKGGNDSKENVVGACATCNVQKFNHLWDIKTGVLYKEIGYQRE